MSARALRPSPTLTQVYVYRQAVDFRYGYRRLAAIVEQELGHNPFSGALYVFVNRQRTKLKILLWEDNGFVLYYKALAEERFCWPRHDQTLLTITGQQLNWLLDGYDIAQLRAHKKLHYAALC